MSLKWYGEAIKAKLRAAQIEGVNATMARCVVHAKNNHEWQNRTGVLEGSIGIADYAHEQGTAVVGRWGSQDVDYAIYQELGTQLTRARPYLRPAADVHYPGLAAAIKAAA